MLVVGLDFETTGLDTAKEHITQVGAVLWDTAALPGRKRAKIKFDAMINNPEILVVDPVITEITGMVLEDLRTFGQSPDRVLGTLNMLIKQAGVVVAHNGNLFDRPMYESNCKRFGIEVVDALWIDTSCDIEYPTTINTRKLVHLAAEHQFINPFPHDAAMDVMTMLKIADLYPWEKTLEWAKSPTLSIRADSTFQQKELVKKQNYRWNGEQKIWTKSIKSFQLEDEKKAAIAAGFKVTVLATGKGST